MSIVLDLDVRCASGVRTLSVTLTQNIRKFASYLLYRVKHASARGGCSVEMSAQVTKHPIFKYTKPNGTPEGVKVGYTFIWLVVSSEGELWFEVLDDSNNGEHITETVNLAKGKDWEVGGE